jgi:ABC-type branched-subunit amino acid transport system ATPase component
MTRSTPDIVARNGVAHAPQEKAIFQDLSVRDNLRLATADERAFRDQVGRIFAIFPFFEQRLSQKAGTLSGGEQKMLIIARAIMVRSAPVGRRRNIRRAAAICHWTDRAGVAP